MNATIRLLSLMSFVVVAVMTVTGPLLPMIANDFSVLVGQAGIVVTAFTVPYGLAQLFCGQGCGVLVFGKIIDNYGYAAVFTSAGLGMIFLGIWFQNRIRALEGNS